MSLEDLKARLAQSVSKYEVGGSTAQAAQPIVPLWKARPKGPVWSTKVNPGQFGDDLRVPDTDTESRGGRITGGRATIPLIREVLTADGAVGSFLDMDEEDRLEFQKIAIDAGILHVGEDGIVTQDDVFNAWERATKYAATFNSERDKDKWLSPWEAAQRLGVSASAGKGSAFDPFRPRSQSSTTRKDFTKGSDAESVTRMLEGLFESEMGRAPTKDERAIYQRLVQKAYDASPEKTTQVSQTDASGNTVATATQSGGIDMTATLLDQVRDTDESDAYQAGTTFFQAAMQALGAIA